MPRHRTNLSTNPLAGASVPDEIVFIGLDELLGYRLRRAQGAVHRDYLATLDNLKLTQKQTAVMWLVMGNPGVAQGAIGNALGMDRATMMVLVDRLESRGLLQRRQSTVDARRRELHVTPAGQKLMEQVRGRIARHEARMKRMFTAPELRTLERLLQRLQGLESRTGEDTDPTSR
jgi:DNA-binding MarR family transcriptional regulator